MGILNLIRKIYFNQKTLTKNIFSKFVYVFINAGIGWNFNIPNVSCQITFPSCTLSYIPGRVAQSVTCLATDACLTADPGVASSIPARSHTFVEIDHEIISTVILLPSADSFKKGCCQLQAKVCAQITG